MTATATKPQMLHALREKLSRAGVQEPAASRYAREFVEDLENGRALAFSDLGRVRWTGRQFVIEDTATPQAAPAQRSAHRLDLREATALGAPSVEEEASLRELVRLGYSREDATIALVEASRERGH